MTRITATRRRLLAGLALLGLPAAAWAQNAASDIPGFQINCARESKAGGVIRRYTAQFDVVGGRLVAKGDPSATLAIQPTATTLARGVTHPRDGQNSLGPAFIERTSDQAGTEGARTGTSIQMGLAIEGRTPETPIAMELFQGRKRVWQGVPELKETADGRLFTLIQKLANPQDAVIKGKLRLVLTMGERPIAEYAFDATKLAGTLAYRDATHRTILGKPYAESALPQGCMKKEAGAGCFVTTAAVETIGLADDCWELQTLRRFRDAALPALPGGDALIRQYYDLAPPMIARINTRPDARRIWLATYWTGVIPSAVCAAVGWNPGAMGCYARALKRLARLAG